MKDTARGAFAGGSLLLERGTVDRVRLTWRLLRDPRVSNIRLAIPALLLAYVVSPVDLIPDVFLGIGQTDDLGIAVLALMITIRLVPRLAPSGIVHAHMQEMRMESDRHEPRDDERGHVIEARFSVRDH